LTGSPLSGAARRAIVGATAVTAAPPDAAPFPVQAVVEEQDTALILDLEPVLRPPQQSYPALVSAMRQQRPRRPGDVIVRRGRPLQLLAVVHDLDEEPGCRAEWIEPALTGILQRCVRYRIRSMALPLLGSVHGRFNGMHFVRLLRTALARHALPYPERLWLIAPKGDCEWIGRYLGKSSK